MDIFDVASSEASRLTAFSGNRLVRDSENRTDNAASAALDDPATEVMVMGGGRLFMRIGKGLPEPLFSRADAGQLGGRDADAVLLGERPKGRVVAMPSSTAPDDLPDGIKAIDYRSVYVQGLLDAETLGELAQGASLLAWHATHRFCGRCGSATRMRAGGYKRQCVKCERELFPRTDPVTIMLAVRDDKCLLGRSPHFGSGMYSCLAGFVEPGETIEDAVRRETLEESGITVGRVAYHASQPWPFPHTLMIGCYGEALNEDIDADLEELEDCRWFDRAEIRKMLAHEHEDGFSTPPQGAIAAVLIRNWAEQA